MPTCGTIEVTPRFDANNVAVSSCTGGAEVTRGETVGVTVTVQNTNNAAANASVSVSVNGSTAGSTTVTVAANSSRDVDFTIDTTDLSPGSHSVSADLSGAQRA